MRRRIICFGDSNTWGFNAATQERFPEGIRWPTLLQQLLGDEFQVIEEGLSGRTSVVDDPLFEGLNGYSYIYPCLMSHSPLELVIIMLGTNDTKERFHLTAYNIAQGITRLALKAKSAPVSKNGSSPKVLVIAPPPIGSGYINSDVGPAMGKGCDRKSLELPKYLEELLKGHDIEFLNTAGKITMNEIDFMHLDENGHRELSKLVFDKINYIL